MIFVLAGDLDGGVEMLTKKASERALQCELFKSLGLAALKAKARRLGTGGVIRLDGREFVVDVDEGSDWMVVLIVLPRKSLESLAVSKANEVGCDLSGLSGEEMAIWMDIFFKELKVQLKRWYQIECIDGPGDNLTFEKPAYKKESSTWR